MQNGGLWKDNVNHDKFSEYESGLMDYLSANNQKTLESIVSSGKIDEATEKELKKALESYSSTINN